MDHDDTTPSLNELEEFDAALDAEDGLGAASLLDGRLLGVLAEQLLRQAADVWDQPAYMVVPVPLDHYQRATGAAPATVSAVGGAQRDDANLCGLATDGEATVASVVLMAEELADGHPYNVLIGRQLPDWAGAVMLVTEGWADLAEGSHLYEAGLRPGPDSPRRADGAVEVRMVNAATRLGSRAISVKVRGGGDPVTAHYPAGSPPRSGELDMTGRIPAVTHRLLGVPSPPIAERLFATLGSAWAAFVSDRWETLLADLGPDEAALRLLALRPDWAAMRRRAVANLLHARCEVLGLDPADDDAVQEAFESGALDISELDDPVAQVPREDPGPAVQLLDRTFVAMLESDDQDDWDLVLESVLGMLPVADPLAVASMVPFMEWFDATTALLHLGLVGDGPSFTQRMRQLEALERIPQWFRESCQRFAVAADRPTAVEPNPHLQPSRV